MLGTWIPPVRGPRPRPRLLALVVLALVAMAAVAAWQGLPAIVAARIRSVAAERGLTASWSALRAQPPLRISLSDLVLVAATHDTVARIERFDIAIDPVSVLMLAPRPASVTMTRARFASASRESGTDDDDGAPASGSRKHADRLPRIRAAARNMARLLMVDPAAFRVTLRDVAVVSSAGGDEPHTALYVDSLDLGPRDGDIHLRARGTVRLEDNTPFTVDLVYRRDGRLLGGARFMLRSGARAEVLPVDFDARIDRGGAPRALRLEDGSRVALGPVAIGVAGYIEPSSPRVHFALRSRDLRPEVLARRVPRALLGPLAGMHVRGSFDYALDFDLDLERPDSMTFHADVTPHGLMLDPAGQALDLTHLDIPFTAQIHLPHGRIVTRELSSANPHFRAYDAIDSTLAHAVVTNEDGGFFRHRGFNTDAVKDAIAENLHAGAYRRGAGTITMQLVRNLYLGHERTLSRKAQEVVLAWMVEHLTGVPKRRLLEIYLNIIEWGPGVHGADEACEYYFGHDAGRVTVDEALFLATVVPAPSRWKNRFAPDGTLRSFERAQMHFIGRAMVAKGWLDAAALPPADALQVELRGPARDALLPATTPRADSLGAEAMNVPPRMEPDAGHPAP